MDGKCSCKSTDSCQLFRLRHQHDTFEQIHFNMSILGFFVIWLLSLDQTKITAFFSAILRDGYDWGWLESATEISAEIGLYFLMEGSVSEPVEASSFCLSGEWYYFLGLPAYFML